MSVTFDMGHMPGYRGILRDISEAVEAITPVREIVDSHGLLRLLEAVNLGLPLYVAGTALFVSPAAFRLYNEIIARHASDDDDEVDPAEQQSEGGQPKLAIPA